VFQVLRQQALNAKLEKCELFTPQVVFLEYIVSGKGIQGYQELTHSYNHHGSL